jgi:hypothetical protein
MARQRLHDMPLAAREAFADACARHGFVWEDFEVAEEGGVVSVAPVAGGDLRAYPTEAGGAPWIVAFERDLARDVFGPPLAD